MWDNWQEPHGTRCPCVVYVNCHWPFSDVGGRNILHRLNGRQSCVWSVVLIGLFIKDWLIIVKIWSPCLSNVPKIEPFLLTIYNSKDPLTIRMREGFVEHLFVKVENKGEPPIHVKSDSRFFKSPSHLWKKVRHENDGSVLDSKVPRAFSGHNSYSTCVNCHKPYYD